MTVKELMEVLKRQKPNARVYIQIDPLKGGNLKSVIDTIDSGHACILNTTKAEEGFDPYNIYIRCN
jgi:hypothetical protein